MQYRKIRLFVVCLILAGSAAAQSKLFSQKKPAANQTEVKSIGGKEHESNILGVKIGMSVPLALETVFINGKRKAGQEKPDAKKTEGKNNKDIRVVYKNLPQGELQMVFADGKFVKEIILIYTTLPLVDDLKLPYTGSLGNSTSLITTQTGDSRGLSQRTETLDGSTEIDGYNAANTGNTDRRRGEALDGVRYDDRYSIGFTDNRKLQRIWWREEKTAENFKIRVQFVSEKVTKAGANLVVRIAQKGIFLSPEDEILFKKSFNLEN